VNAKEFTYFDVPGAGGGGAGGSGTYGPGVAGSNGTTGIITKLAGA